MTVEVRDQPALEAALQYCERITRSRARNFYYGLKLAPEPKRSALFVLYAWMRRVDDLVDGMGADDPASARRALERFGVMTERALEDPSLVESTDHLWRAVGYMGERYPVRPEDFRDMLHGQMQDLSVREYETFDDLRSYCYRVASTVGRLCVTIWGYDSDEAPRRAIDRGIAFQLTNILRDYAEDYDHGRIYLPVEDFRRHAITPQQLRTWAEPARCTRFMNEQIERAETFYQSSASLDSMIAADCRPVLWAMTEIYHGLLEKIRENPARIAGEKRIRLSTLRKSLIALEARRMRKVTL